jgi:RES domain-containing protein
LELMIRAADTCRLVPSRYPAVGILDRVASPEDLPFIFELESWTNDRISTELGILHRIPPEEWVTGRPMASVIMAAFCHPRTGGGRFNGPDRGAWYAGTELATAHAEVAYHRTRELAEIGVFETRVQMRLYLADFRADFRDVRPSTKEHVPLHDPNSYAASQAFARELLAQGAAGAIYRSVRRPGGECLACFRPALVLNVRSDAHFEYRWEGRSAPAITKLLTTPAPKPRSAGRRRR